MFQCCTTTVKSPASPSSPISPASTTGKRSSQLAIDQRKAFASSPRGNTVGKSSLNLGGGGNGNLSPRGRSTSDPKSPRCASNQYSKQVSIGIGVTDESELNQASGSTTASSGFDSYGKAADAQRKDSDKRLSSPGDDDEKVSSARTKKPRPPKRSERLRYDRQSVEFDEEPEGPIEGARGPEDKRSAVGLMMQHVDTMDRTASEKNRGERKTLRSTLMAPFTSKPDPKIRLSAAAVFDPATRIAQRSRRNSQAGYANESQTIIVFDWDDTLFPTSYLLDDLGLSSSVPLPHQRISSELKKHITEAMRTLSNQVCELLRFANTCGKVVLVTLARSPWVTLSCELYYAQVGKLLHELGLKIVYAQEGVQVDYNKKEMEENARDIYTAMKANAIQREVEEFYSQYEGQSWKNIISIGDGQFERLGTQKMSLEYMEKHGIASKEEISRMRRESQGMDCVSADVNGQVFRLRTKTLKMLDSPTIDELNTQLRLNFKWLPSLVQLDDVFDMDLQQVEDEDSISKIEAKLGFDRALSPKSPGHSPKTKASGIGISRFIPWRGKK